MINARSFVYSLGAVLIGSVLLTTTATADDTIDEWSIDDDSSVLTFESEAPMESFSGTSEQISGTLEWNRDNPRESTGEISFPVDSMRTGNSTRDRHLTEEDWLNAEENPTVRFTLEGLDDLRAARPDGQIHYRGTARGTIELNGVENDTEADIWVAILPEDRIVQIKPELEFDLEDYNVEGVGGDRAIGTAVAETIEVHGELRATWD